MKLNLETPITGLDGVVKEGDKDLSLKTVLTRAVATPLESDRGTPAEKVAERWALAVKLNMGGEIDLSPEQVADLRKRVAEVFILNVAGPTLALLNG